MTPKTFPQATHMMADDQPEFLLLPAARVGQVTISCWELSDYELETLKRTKCLWVEVLTGYTGPLQAMRLGADSPFESDDELLSDDDHDAQRYMLKFAGGSVEHEFVLAGDYDSLLRELARCQARIGQHSGADSDADSDADFVGRGRSLRIAQSLIQR